LTEGVLAREKKQRKPGDPARELKYLTEKGVERGCLRPQPSVKHQLGKKPKYVFRRGVGGERIKETKRYPAKERWVSRAAMEEIESPRRRRKRETNRRRLASGSQIGEVIYLREKMDCCQEAKPHLKKGGEMMKGKKGTFGGKKGKKKGHEGRRGGGESTVAKRGKGSGSLKSSRSGSRNESILLDDPKKRGRKRGGGYFKKKEEWLKGPVLETVEEIKNEDSAQ